MEAWGVAPHIEFSQFNVVGLIRFGLFRLTEDNPTSFSNIKTIS